jgi:adenine-specific DNA-methyltransferase
MAKKQKLELTWIGKDEEVKLEPRVLIEDTELSYGDSETENIIIHGDNLLALKALEQDYTGKVKCIYIDPPYNTGNAFEHYDDGLEHSIWLNLFTQRVKILHNLLDKDGVFFVQLDDNELDYAKIILDQTFLRRNFINRITIEARSPSAFSTVNPGVFKSSEYILMYAKDKSFFDNRSLRINSKRDTAYNKFILNRNQDHVNWNFIPLKLAFLEYLNQEKLFNLNTFISNIFNKKSLSKKELQSFIEEFIYAVMIDSKKLSTYLHTKLKEEVFDNFKENVYQYLLEIFSSNYSEKDMDKFVFENSDAVCRETEISDTGAGKDTVKLKYISLENPNIIHLLKRENYDDIYIYNGKQISFYAKNIAEIDGELTPSKLLTNIWTDISWEGISKEGRVTFKKSKKPEALIRRILELSTNKDDIVLDSFLGSGTTAAVAHKMNRKYIGIELGEHAKSHVVPRLKRIIDGDDKSGISKIVNWQGGGGFKFYTLAPSLLTRDKFNNWVIEPTYDATLLASALAKQEGFKYYPDKDLFWKQGYSTETDYIFTTTQFVTTDLIDKIHDEMKEDETLLICTKSFHKACESAYKNIAIKKIPQVLLGKCEFGKDDYSLNILENNNDEISED